MSNLIRLRYTNTLIQTTRKKPMLRLNQTTKRSTQILITSALLVILVGCTWVKKTPGAASIRVVPADRVADCKNLGNVSVSTLNNVSIVNRKAAKVEKELETIAQNEAAESKADTIVAMSKIVEGRRTYAMYNCLK